MSTIDHYDGSSTSIDQEPDGSWSVVTTDANGSSGSPQSFGAGYTAQELTEKYTYPNDVVSSTSVEHDDGTSTVYDQLASGGWSVYSVDANGDRGSSHEYGSSYTLDDLQQGTPNEGTQREDSARDQSQSQTSQSAQQTETSASDATPDAPHEQGETSSNDGAAKDSAGDEAGGGAEAGGSGSGEGEGSGGEGGGEGGKGEEGGGG